MALQNLKPVSRRWVFAHMTDSSTASSAFALSPFRGRIVKAGSVIYNAITGTNSAMTVKIAGTTVTGLAWTITQSGSAAGDYDEGFPTALSTTYVKEGDNIEFVSDGAASTACPTTCFAEIEMD